MSHDKCGECRHFDPETEVDGSFGSCLRYPPVPMWEPEAADLTTTYPVVGAAWRACGEFVRPTH